MKVPLIINAMHAYLDVCRGEKKTKTKREEGAHHHHHQDGFSISLSASLTT